MVCGQMLFKLTIYDLFIFVVASLISIYTSNCVKDCSGISRITYCLDVYKNTENIEIAPKKRREETTTKTGTKRSRVVKNISTKKKLRKTGKSRPTGKSTKRRKTSRNSKYVKKVEASIEMTTVIASTTKFIESDSLGLVVDMEPQIDMSQLKLKVDKNGCYVINVHVRRSAADRVLGVGRKRLNIEIAAPEYEEALNAEISRFLSKLFRVSRRSVKLQAGVGANIKKFVIPKTAILHNSTLKSMVAPFDLQRKKIPEC